MVSFIKPHKKASTDMTAKWIKLVLYTSGIDTGKFTAGSICSTAASEAKARRVPVSHILAKDDWSNKTTFAKHYNKVIVPEGDPFKVAVLRWHKCDLLASWRLELQHDTWL